MRVLIADDELAVRTSISRALELKGYRVETAADGREALVRLTDQGFDALVLDLMMPGVDGLEVCRQMRALGNGTPVLMLDAGADDYLVKPFALEELLARLRALLRRAPTNGDRPAVLRFSDLSMDTGAYEVSRGERRIDLTRTEFVLLELLLRHPRQVLTRSTIFERVWGYDFGSGSNSLGVYVGYLRRKLEEGGEPRLLHTVRGVGYVLREA